MKKNCFILFICLFITYIPLFAQSEYQNAWKALDTNDRTQARQYLQNALKKNESPLEANLTLALLEILDGQDEKMMPFYRKAIQSTSNPYPYLYALWFSADGTYKKKSKEELQAIDNYLKDPNINGSIRAALHYVKGIHYLENNQVEKANEEYKKMQHIDKWQIVGIFDNLLGSGFDKNYEPIQKPQPDAVFTSYNFTETKWFSMGDKHIDSWSFLKTHFKAPAGIIYAQSFVYSPSDREALLCLGGGGNFKAWCNDRLVISESEERSLELDVYKAKINLKKGYNRILLQVGYYSFSQPNFIVRITDSKYNALTDLKATDQYQTYPKDNESFDANNMVKHFAEEFFEQKIKEEPTNLIHHILLCETYFRNKKHYEARKIASNLVKEYPKNSVFSYYLMQCLLKSETRTELLKEVDKLKENDPNCFFSMTIEIQQLIQEEQYDKALEFVERMEKMYGESEETLDNRISIMQAKKNINEVITLIEKGYKTYPESLTFLDYYYSYLSGSRKDYKGALSALEKYNKNDFDAGVIRKLVSTYLQNNNLPKALSTFQMLIDVAPYDSDLYEEMLELYFNMQQYATALEYAQKCTELAPYYWKYWYYTGLVLESLKKTAQAKEAYEKALYYDPTRFEIRKKINEINKTKADVEELLLPATDVYGIIKNDKYESKEDICDWYYIVDEKTKIVYPEGVWEDNYNLAVRVLNEKGFDYWQQLSLPYNAYNQRLLIEKAEVIKASGSKIKAEQNDNEIVFTNLEKGDAVYVKYKVENYGGGRFGRDFWDSYNFNASVPSVLTRYIVLASNRVHFDYKMKNSTLQPIISEANGYKKYCWEMKDLLEIKAENYMGSSGDIAIGLDISSIKTWKDVALWYSDVSTAQAKADYEIKELLKELFPDGKTFSETEKAKIIYEYIVKNITYSSIPFRQSAYVPQKAVKVLNTRLGDCKDVSTLFATMAREVGLKVNLVLVLTRDNGKNSLPLPSLDFNHCIVKVMLDNKPFYLELTDAFLPFKSLPPHLIDAQILEIPYQNETLDFKLQNLKSTDQVGSSIARKSTIKINGLDIMVENRSVRYGYPTSYMRYKYKNLDAKKQKEEFQKGVMSDFKNPVTFHSITFGNLENNSDSVEYNYKYSVQDEILNLENLSALKVPYSDVFVSLSHFSEEERVYPIEYWDYDEIEKYSEEITIQLPTGKQFVSIPSNVELTFENLKFSLQYTKKDAQTLVIRREVDINQTQILPQSYKAFKEFVGKVVAEEKKYITFK